jgi:hypothetical protein
LRDFADEWRKGTENRTVTFTGLVGLAESAKQGELRNKMFHIEIQWKADYPKQSVINVYG